jgi:DNA-binding response OmpR family regulator
MARILLISPQQVLQSVIAHLLNQTGHELRPATTLLAASDGDGARTADILMVDAQCAGEAEEACVRALRRQSEPMRLLVLSGGPLAIDLQFASRVGADRILPVPFTEHGLLAAIHALAPAGGSGASASPAAGRRPPANVAPRRVRDRYRRG